MVSTVNRFDNFSASFKPEKRLNHYLDYYSRILNEDSQWRDVSLKTIEKLTLTLIDSIMKRNLSGNIWPFKSINPWILLYRATIKFVMPSSFHSILSFTLNRRDPKKNEQFLTSYVRTVHELFGK